MNRTNSTVYSWRLLDYCLYTLQLGVKPHVLPAWLYAMLCADSTLFVQVCLSQIRCSVKTAEQIEVVLALRLSSTSPTPCKRKFQHLQKIRALPSRTLSQTPDLQNLLHGTSLSTKLIDNRALLTTLATVDAPRLDRFVYILYTHRAHSLLHVRRFVSQNIAQKKWCAICLH